jgi:hypothetical protein
MFAWRIRVIAEQRKENFAGLDLRHPVEAVLVKGIAIANGQPNPEIQIAAPSSSSSTMTRTFSITGWPAHIPPT